MKKIIGLTPFEGWGRGETTETQQSGHTLRSGLEVKNGSSVEDGIAPTSRRLNITWWCSPRPSIREMGRNGETSTSKGPAIRLVTPNHLEKIGRTRHHVIRCR